MTREWMKHWQRTPCQKENWHLWRQLERVGWKGPVFRGDTFGMPTSGKCTGFPSQCLHTAPILSTHVQGDKYGPGSNLTNQDRTVAKVIVFTAIGTLVKLVPFSGTYLISCFGSSADQNLTTPKHKPDRIQPQVYYYLHQTFPSVAASTEKPLESTKITTTYWWPCWGSTTREFTDGAVSAMCLGK